MKISRNTFNPCLLETRDFSIASNKNWHKLILSSASHFDLNNCSSICASLFRSIFAHFRLELNDICAGTPPFLPRPSFS